MSDRKSRIHASRKQWPTTLLIIAMIPVLMASHTPKSEVYREKLRPTTGFNDLCGAAVFPVAPNVTFTAAHNPVGPDPIVLTPEFCADNPDAVLATWANADFYAANGWPMPDARLVNVPYERVHVGVDWAGTRALVEDHAVGSTQPLPPTRSIPNDVETIESFTGVEGKMKLKCYADRSAHIRIVGKNYQPKEVLTVWMVWGNAPDSGLPPVLPQPLGGVPNTVVADLRGKFVFERELGFCPMHDVFGSSRPLAIDIAGHLDGVTYGAYPENPLAEFTFVDPDTGKTFASRGLGAGMTGVDKGMFPLLIDG